MIYLLCGLHVWAQEFQFKLNWKVGDKKVVIASVHQSEYENGVQTLDTTEVDELEVKVINETKDAFYVNIHQENVALKVVARFFDKVGDPDLVKYKDMDLVYRFDKKTGNTTLENWKEIKTYVEKSMGSVEKYMKKKMPDDLTTVSFLFSLIKMNFQTQKDIEAYFDRQVDYLRYPLDQKITIGDTMKVIGKEANPFNKGDTLATTVKYVIKNLNPKTQQCEVWEKMEVDFSAFKKIMKDMMAGMMGAFGVADSTKVDQLNKMDDFIIYSDVQKLTQYNYATSWPESYVANSKVVFKVPNKKTESFKTVSVKLW